MPKVDRPPLHGLDEDAALRTILEGTATETGERFFVALVENLARALGTHGAWVTEFVCAERKLRALALLLGDQWLDNFEIDITGTPCETVIEQRRLVHFPDNVLTLYPNAADMRQVGAVSYMGAPLMDIDGGILGHIAVLDTRPMPEEPRLQTLFRIFAARAAAELRRLRAESEVREREEELGRLVDSAMDAVIELDPNLKVTLVNPAAEKVFSCLAGQAVGQDFARFLSPESGRKLTALIADLDRRPPGQQSMWIPGGLRAVGAAGVAIVAEATLSRFEIRRETYHTLILRNINERLAAEEKIRSLTVETQYLREEVKALHNFDEIIGQSDALLRVLRDVEQVAATNATVLILGETGTGKELFARAIHAASTRRDRPLVKVNCAAIPAALIESELFGHERGAFTGATQRRDGRFTLADRGTLFLDEVGELPLDLQVKLLRVLQEGEFEPVGSSRTRKVNVRVIAATNRDLRHEVQHGRFREDLYYRLDVFPIQVPPLRERRDDIAPLAATFVRRFAQETGRAIAPLSPGCIERLQAYGWPGNVRELENVIERAVITSRDGRANIERALPEARGCGVVVEEPLPERGETRVLTIDELQALERANVLRALERTGWRVSGDDGAARLLAVHPSTLRSRMKALGIERPR